MTRITPGAELTWTRTVAEDQPARYAAASGDDNPIHLDDEVARAAGLPGRVLHGMCTLSFAHQALVAWAGGDDPRAVKGLKARFKGPVQPGDEVTVHGRVESAEDGEARLTLRATNQDGAEVLGDGEALVALDAATG